VVETPEIVDLSLNAGNGVNRKGPHIVATVEASTSRRKERYAASNDNPLKLIQPGCFDDQRTEILRQDARTVLAHAIAAEVQMPSQHRGWPPTPWAPARRT
jgi:hypothetical protein